MSSVTTKQQEDNATNFDKICEFQEAFEMKSFSNGITQEEINDNPEIIKLRIDLIVEELNELKQAINEKDITEMRDAIGDILYVVYGAAHTFGFDADSDFATIHDSNMSKLCKTEEEAQQTVAKYEQDFKDGKTSYDSPYYYNNEKTSLWIVKNRSTGKVLKSIHYTPVKFE